MPRLGQAFAYCDQFKMNNRSNRGGHRPMRGSYPARKDPLSDERFNDLLSKAGAFFAAAEKDVEGERAAMIESILQTLESYGLSVEDLK